ncbi:MAG: hypothetical protein ACJA1Q_003062, partial [Pseudohongiellaceae bacterium]
KHRRFGAAGCVHAARNRGQDELGLIPPVVDSNRRRLLLQYVPIAGGVSRDDKLARAYI